MEREDGRHSTSSSECGGVTSDYGMEVLLRSCGAWSEFLVSKLICHIHLCLGDLIPNKNIRVGKLFGSQDVSVV